MADTRDAMVRELVERRYAFLEHDIHGKRRSRGELCDESAIDEARHKEAVGARVTVPLCALEHFGDHLLTMRRGRALKEDVRACVDEEGEPRCLRGSPRAADSNCLVGGAPQSTVNGDAVLDIASHRADADCERDRGADSLRLLSIAALEVHRYGKVGCADDPAQVLYRKGKR